MGYEEKGKKRKLILEKSSHFLVVKYSCNIETNLCFLISCIL
jgi:hypothetical protein